MNNASDRPERRRLWLPPAPIRHSHEGERQVAFLELFFDLVFVVLIAQLAHHLAAHPSWSAFGWFALLFFIVWSAWLNGSFYHDAHGTDDLSIRVITFAQMIALAVMGAFIGDVPGEGDMGFALAYAGSSLLLAIIWARTGVHDPEHRSGAYPYAVAFVVSACFFVGSVFVDGAAVYWMWAVGVAAQASAAVPASRVLRREFGAVLATPSLVERFGLIVIIVLGEVVAGAITGMASHRPITLSVVAVGVLGVLLAIALWWLYFDLVAERRHRSGQGLWWMYLHIPLIIGIAGSGAAVLAAVEQMGESAEPPGTVAIRWLLVGTVALTLVCVAGLLLTVTLAPEQRRAGLTAEVSLVAAALVVLGVGLLPASAATTLVITLVVLLLPLVPSVNVWRTR